MPKDIKKGDDFLLYLNTGTQAAPTWVLITQAVNPQLDPATSDIVIQEANMSDGHLAGFGDPSITFKLNVDKGDANVDDMIAAIHSGALTEIALADGLIATTGTVYYRLESCLRGALSAQRGEGASYDVTANRHANSVADLTKVTVA